MTKTVILHNYMIPHSFPILNELVQNKDIDLEVFYLAASAKNRRWKITHKNLNFKYKLLPNFQTIFFKEDFFTYIINPTIIWELIKSQYDVVISDGWLDLSCQLAFLMTKILGKKYVLWSESTKNEPSWRRTIALPMVKMMVVHSDAYLVRGTRAREYLISLGADPQKIFLAPCVIDIEFFHRQSKISPSEKKKLKDRFHIRQDSLVILYSGQLIKRKGLIYLLQAFSEIESKYKNVTLVFQGYGPEKENLFKQCFDENIKNVVFSDHLEIEEIPKIYALADIFVLPSYEETWGRVINEAMACGLPIITTQKVGASVDLVKDGVNGLVVQAENSLALQKAIESLITNDDLRKRMGRASWEISKKYFTPAIAAQGISEAIKFVSEKQTR